MEPKRLLIVDDEKDILNTLKSILSDEGFNVTCALSGREAIDLYRSEPFDLVITDMKMPEMNGDEVIRQIKMIDENVEIIVLTGHASIDNAVNSLKYGAFDYLSKPLEDLDQFINTVHQALAKRELFVKNKELRDQLEHFATHDPLSGLPNRRMFNERLNMAIRRAKRRNTPVFLLVVDLDHFKNVNDTMGHKAGDRLLIQAARRMQACIRESDLLSRIGGDEFFIVIENAEDPQYVAEVAQRLIREIGKPFFIEKQEARIGTSIGIAAYPADGDYPDILVKHADIAMYRVKKSGRNGYQFFTKEMSDRVAEKVILHNLLSNAVIQKDFHIRYLPLVDMKTNRIFGVEALLRWHTGINGGVGPDVFIPLMEQAGLIDTVFRWVLENSCGQCKIWREKGYPDLKLSVNLSPHQFGCPDLPGVIKETLADRNFNPGLLWLEITEGLFREEEETAGKILGEIKNIGVDKIILDDFGTGFSSLRYLTKYPIDGLKVDNELIRDMNSKSATRSLVAAIVSMAIGLNLKTVTAEGVEFEDQLPILREFGCTSYQGYLHSRPTDAKGLEALLCKERDFPQVSAASHDFAKTCNILIVEDNPFNRTIMKSILAMAEYKSDTVSTGTEAIRQVKTNHYDLILIDIMLPDMKGYELSEKIREIARQDVMIVGVTAHDQEIQKRFLTSGMNDFLLKPVSIENLVPVVEKWMLAKPASGKMKS